MTMTSRDLRTAIRALVADAVAGLDHAERDHEEDLIAEMLESGIKLLRDDTDRGDLKLVNSALKELRYSFITFSRYKGIPKATIYGSARTEPDHPNYQIAAEFANRMTDTHRWMIITGAGPGIMEAGNKGAGRERGFGVNIRLPFEAEANEYVDQNKLINFKYFFTRKLMFVKESHAFALFPGGFGTQDEAFELLTLIQTGKSPVAPVVLVDAPGSEYWRRWIDFVSHLEEEAMISPHDMHLFKAFQNVDEACDEILHFYRSYHSQRYVGDKLVLRLHREPSAALMRELNHRFSDIVASGSIEKIEATEQEVRDNDVPELARIRLHYIRRSVGKLRLLIDYLNDHLA